MSNKKMALAIFGLYTFGLSMYLTWLMLKKIEATELMWFLYWMIILFSVLFRILPEVVDE